MRRFAQAVAIGLSIAVILGLFHWRSSVFSRPKPPAAAAPTTYPLTHLPEPHLAATGMHAYDPGCLKRWNALEAIDLERFGRRDERNAALFEVSEPENLLQTIAEAEA